MSLAFLNMFAMMHPSSLWACEQVEGFPNLGYGPTGRGRRFPLPDMGQMLQRYMKDRGFNSFSLLQSQQPYEGEGR